MSELTSLGKFMIFNITLLDKNDNNIRLNVIKTLLLYKCLLRQEKLYLYIYGFLYLDRDDCIHMASDVSELIHVKSNNIKHMYTCDIDMKDINVTYIDGHFYFPIDNLLWFSTIGTKLFVIL